MEIRIIRDESDYKEALSYVEELITKGEKRDADESEKLDVLVTLIQDYESRISIKTIPDPIDAIEFVLEQRNMSHDDLIAFIGSRSKVSEVLSRKRPLSINMIKNLHEGLGISAKTLINQNRNNESKKDYFDSYLIKEVYKRGYISNKTQADLDSFIAQSVNPHIYALLSRNYYVRSAITMNPKALIAWVEVITNKAKAEGSIPPFQKEAFTVDFLKQIVDLSDEEDAIYKVRDLLKSKGIYLVVEPHFSQTYLDGAAIMIKGSNPIVGMTLRRDTLDNFWYTLIHELSHIYLHYGKGTNLFYDDIETFDMPDHREQEADDFGSEVLVPKEIWDVSPAKFLSSEETARLLASQLSVHPSIIAGKMRYERKHFHFLNNLIGHGEVQKLFPENKWSK